MKKQLELLKLRNSHPVFTEGASVIAEHPEPGILKLTWLNGSAKASLTADAAGRTYAIEID